MLFINCFLLFFDYDRILGGIFIVKEKFYDYLEYGWLIDFYLKIRGY